MIIREWRERDTPILQQWFGDDPDLWKAMGYPVPVHPADVEDIVAARQTAGAILAVECGGELVALVTINPRLSPTTGVVHLTVAPHRRGYGVEIAKAALEEAKRRGYTELLAPAAPLIDPAIHQRWLRAAGFVVRHYGAWHA